MHRLFVSFFFFFFFGERHTDCVFQRRVPTSIHHGTTLGQIHRKGSNPSSDYFIHVDLRPVNSSICKCSAERRVVVPLWERKQQWQKGEKLFPLVVLSASRRARTLFVVTRMSAGISDWSTFEVCIVYVCLIWEDWLCLILSWHVQREDSHKEISNGVIDAGVL